MGNWPFSADWQKTCANGLAILRGSCEIGARAELRVFQPNPLCEPALWVASVAQLAEQLTLNQLVLGSSPSRGTNSAPLIGA